MILTTCVVFSASQFVWLPGSQALGGSKANKGAEQVKRLIVQVWFENFMSFKISSSIFLFLVR